MGNPLSKIEILPEEITSALKRLTSTVNLSTGLAHPSDQQHAQRIFKELQEKGCKADEQADERFYMNLAKAACTTLVLIVLSLIVLSIVTFFLPFTLRTGMVLIFTASMIVFFDLFFLIFEKRG